MKRIGDERTFAVVAWVPGDLLAAAQDHDLVDEALHHDVTEAIGGRHRVVVGAVADERRRGDAAAALLAGLQRHCRQRAQQGQISGEPLTNGLGVAASALVLASTAALSDLGVQRVEARRGRDRHHELGASILHQTLDLALVVALAGPPEAVLKQVVADQFGKGPRPLTLAVAQDLGHRDGGVVVQNRQRHAAEEGERRHMPVEECFGGLLADKP